MITEEDVKEIADAYRQALLEHGIDLGIAPRYIEILVNHLTVRLLGVIR